MSILSGRRRLALAGVSVAALLCGVVAGTAGPAAAADPPPSGGRAPGHHIDTSAIPGRYIVVLKNKAASAGTVSATARTLTGTYGGTVTRAYTRALRGFAATMSAEQARRMAARPEVAYVEQDKVVKLADTQVNPPSWGLDRVDQPYRPLDSSYTYPGTASTVHAYIIDTGIHISHQDFGGRATYGYDFVANSPVAEDCHGHGTHVAGTVGGTTYGVAKGVQLVAVRVLDCSGSGSYSGVIAGIDWVTANAARPAVANMSLAGGYSAAVNDAVTASIASGVTYALAAANNGLNACSFSPASTPVAITVGATDRNDVRPYFSNFGSCLDLFAPGVDIWSDWYSDDTATNLLSGTSMASPHVAGAAALILAAHPAYTPQQVRDAIVRAAVTGAVTDLGIGSPNKLLRIGDPGTFAPMVIRFKARANKLIVDASPSGTSPLIANRAVAGLWEEFDVVDAGSGYVALCAHSNGRFVTADASGTAPLVNDATTVGTAQKFQLLTNSDGSLSLKAASNGRYVTAESAGARPLINNRTTIGLWERFDAAVPPTVIALWSWADFRYVTAERAGALPLYANRASVGSWETFDAIDLGNGRMALRAHANGRYVTAENAGAKSLIANRTGVGGWETFIPVYNADGSISLFATANGRYVTAERAGALPLIANRTGIGTWEEFDLVFM